MSKGKNSKALTILSVVGIIFIVVIIVAGIMSQNSSKEDKLLDSLRKCSVMEGADIYNTQPGDKTENVFDKAKETCSSWVKQWGEENFIKNVNEDWESRKNEQVDGKPLEHFLSVLNW